MQNHTEALETRVANLERALQTVFSEITDINIRLDNPTPPKTTPKKGRVKKKGSPNR